MESGCYYRDLEDAEDDAETWYQCRCCQWDPNKVIQEKEKYQTSTYTILENGAYSVHHDLYKNHKIREIWKCLSLGTAMMGVASNKLCRHLSTRLSIRKRVGILRTTSVLFGLPFSWAKRK